MSKARGGPTEATLGLLHGENALPEPEPTKFEVMVDDNYHYMDEDYRRLAGTFDTYEEALAVAKRIVIESVKKCATGKRSAAEICGYYRMFGDDPFIRPSPKGVKLFSAWKFAEKVANAMARGERVDDRF